MALLSAKIRKIRSKIKVLEFLKHYTSIFKRLRADYSRVSGRIWPKFELIQVLCISLSPARMKMIQSKIKGLEWSQNFSPLLVYRDYSRHSKTANTPVLGPIRPNLELVLDVMAVLVTCKNKDPIWPKTL